MIPKKPLRCKGQKITRSWQNQEDFRICKSKWLETLDIMHAHSDTGGKHQDEKAKAREHQKQFLNLLGQTRTLSHSLFDFGRRSVGNVIYMKWLPKSLQLPHLMTFVALLLGWLRSIVSCFSCSWAFFLHVPHFLGIHPVSCSLHSQIVERTNGELGIKVPFNLKSKNLDIHTGASTRLCTFWRCKTKSTSDQYKPKRPHHNIPTLKNQTKNTSETNKTKRKLKTKPNSTKNEKPSLWQQPGLWQDIDQDQYVSRELGRQSRQVQKQGHVQSDNEPPGITWLQ